MACIDLLSLQASLLLMKHWGSALNHTLLSHFLIEDHSLWFFSALIFFHKFLTLCMHEVWVPSNNIVFSLYIFKGLLCFSILVLLEDFSWNKNSWSLSMLLRCDICLTLWTLSLTLRTLRFLLKISLTVTNYW